jgi:CTP:molybdopterin cytidylyltransferase MocA
MVACLIMPSAQEPLVSVVVACYNRAALVEQAVRSALGQDWKHLEVVVSDDASADDSVGVLRRMEDPRLRVRAQTANVGVWKNWGAALGMARGDFVVFLGDDDWLSPDFVRKHLEAFRRHPSASAVFSPLEDRPDDGSPSGFLPSPFPEDRTVSGAELVGCLLDSKVFFGSAMFRREPAQRLWAGTESDGMVADWGLILGLGILPGVAVASCEGCLYVKRVHANRLSSRTSEVTALLASVCERVASECGDPAIRPRLKRRATFERITLSRHHAAVGDLQACRRVLWSCLGRADAQGIVISQLVQAYLAPARLVRTAREQRRAKTT